MSFSTDWDINQYKTDYESEEHWELRKSFIETHKDKFAESELVCLAQVFTNIEFLGCRYPHKTMERVALLSKEVAAKFREARSGRLKRTFVGASDAASMKAKGRTQDKSPFNHNKGPTAIPTLFSSFTKQQTTDTDQESTSVEESTRNPEPNAKESESSDDEMQRPSFSMNPAIHFNAMHPPITTNSEVQALPPQKLKRIQDTGFIIYESLANSEQKSTGTLQESAAKQGAIFKCEEEVSTTQPNTVEYVVRINGNIYASAPITATNKETKKETKIKACDKALELARKIHYTIKQKAFNTLAVDQNVEQNSDESNGTSSAQGKQLDADNKGFKMMKMLGWSGGALGVSGSGIEQPINIEMKVDRSGLGLSSDSTKLNYDFFVSYLTKYKTDETATYDLAFSKDFTKEERKTLHEIANRLQLKSRSHNKPDGSRHIIIFKRLQLTDLANEILNNGFRAKCYELITPSAPLPFHFRPHGNRNHPPPQSGRNQANKSGFNYAHQRKPHNPKRQRFF